MEGQVIADLAQMSDTTIALLIGGIAALLIILALVFVFVVRKLGISNLGPIRMMDRHSRVIEYHMNAENSTQDDTCRKEMRRITSNMRLALSNIFADENVCALARVGIAAALRYPLYESVANDNFTTELTAHY